MCKNQNISAQQSSSVINFHPVVLYFNFEFALVCECYSEVTHSCNNWCMDLQNGQGQDCSSCPTSTCVQEPLVHATCFTAIIYNTVGWFEFPVMRGEASSSHTYL